MISCKITKKKIEGVNTKNLKINKDGWYGNGNEKREMWIRIMTRRLGNNKKIDNGMLFSDEISDFAIDVHNYRVFHKCPRTTWSISYFYQ